MGVETSLFALPESCSLLEAAKGSDEQAEWLSCIPIWLEDFGDEHPPQLNDLRPRPTPWQNWRIQQFQAPFYAPFRKIWSEYINLRKEHPGLETRYCEGSKMWTRLTNILPKREIAFNGSKQDLSWRCVHGVVSLSADRITASNPSEMVLEIAIYLNDVTAEQLDTKNLTYHSFGYDDQEMDNLKEYFTRLQKFYYASADHGEAIVTYY